MNKNFRSLTFIVFPLALLIAIVLYSFRSKPKSTQAANETLETAANETISNERPAPDSTEEISTNHAAEYIDPLAPFSQSDAYIRNDPNDLFPDAEILATPGLPEQKYAQSVHNLMQEYAIIVKDGGYPTGLNVEITNALLGKNQKKIALLPQSHPRINSQGELVDQWNTPYQFHLQSLQQMSVRSAGPDRELFTEDDVIVGEEASDGSIF